ncbi:unnamed protein product [Rotaria sp. Silwood1]|nr:unnamed protein product [Rotaria sp. Silwood1]
MIRVVLLLLIISATFVDSRARRKRRQLSSASYYISDVSPYSGSYSPSSPLTYPSGSYYNAPNYGNLNTGYNGNQPPYMNYYGSDLSQYGPGYSSDFNNQYPFGTSQTYEFPNLGSTYGSGLYGAYGTLSYGYAPTGFNNRYPNWEQGNINQYFTGGTGSGLIPPNYQWYRSFRNVPFQGRSGGSLERNSNGPNLPVSSDKSTADINGSANRRRRRLRRQTSGSLYGTNAGLGASAPAGFNYPANTNIGGIRMNNPDARDIYGNPMGSSSITDNTLQNVNLYGLQRPQQQPPFYGTNDQSSLNSLYNGNNYYSGSGTNPLLRDQYGNPISPVKGSVGTSYYSSSNSQMPYPANPNQVLTNKDFYGTSSNTNNNQYSYNNDLLPNRNNYGGPMDPNANKNFLPNANNNQYSYNNDLGPNSNTYGGPMDPNANKNFLPNTNNNQYSYNNDLGPNSNTYGGPMDPNANKNFLPNTNNNNQYSYNKDLMPNRNTYGGPMDPNANKNSWTNTNTHNRFNQNPGNSLYPNRDDNFRNSNKYGQQNPFYYNNSYRLTVSYFVIFLSFFGTIV